LPEIYEWERQLLRRGNNNDEKLLSVSAKIDDATTDIFKQNQYQAISTRLWVNFGKSGKARSKRMVEKFTELFDDPLLKNESKAHSFVSRIHFYFSHIFYYRAIGNYKKSCEYSRKSLELFSNMDDSLKIELMSSYISCLQNHLLSSVELRDIKECEMVVKELKELYHSPLIINQLSSQVRIFTILYTMELDIFTDSGEFEKAEALLEEVEAGLNKFENLISDYDRITFYFCIAAIHFGKGEYRKALPWFNNILQEPAVRGDLHSSLRIRMLLTHYEIGNQEVLEYFIKSTYRFLVKENRINKLEACVLNYIRKITGLNTRKQLIDFYKELKDQLQLIVKDPLENKFLEYFDIISWLESKIEGRTFSEVIKRKHISSALNHLQGKRK
jgi:tetratricopeptide (TPR) repeat protein